MSRLLEVVGAKTYADAGVSIEAGDDVVARITSAVTSTHRAEVLGGIGGFGGLFALDTTKYQEPVLVASAPALSEKVPDPSLRPHSIELTVGGLLDLDECTSTLVEMGYERVSQVDDRGQAVGQVFRLPDGRLVLVGPSTRSPGP